MTGLICFLVISGGVVIICKTIGVLWDFFAPTRGYIKRQIIGAVSKIAGISHDIANALWTIFVFAVIALIVITIVS